MSNIPFFSICIPAYEYGDEGDLFLNKLLYSINLQTFKNFEIIVSDQSQNENIKNVVLYWNKLNINYIKNDLKGKSSYNINNAIKYANGRIIKPMFQDDYFLNPKCLQFIHDNIEENTIWGAVDCVEELPNHIFINYNIPTYYKDILEGNNKIGNISVTFFKNELNLFFDENLLWLMDCEFYYKLKQISEPKLLSDFKMPNIAIFKSDKSITKKLITTELINNEKKYIENKYFKT